MRPAALAACVALAACDEAAPEPAPAFELVGHSDLLARGMNAAPAIAGDTLYVGSRTSGEVHDDAGILIVDIADPTVPAVVGAIGAPDADLAGMTSRELRAVPDLDLLVVLSFPCGDIHDCFERPAEPPNIKIYDIADRRAPALLATRSFGTLFQPSPASPHEFFLWRDPADPARVLLFMATPVGPPAFQVMDLSDPANPTTPYTWDPEDDAGLDEPRGENTLLHSVSVTDDGRTALFSYLSAGLFLVDTGDIADGAAEASIELLTPLDARVDYSPPAAPGTHSAVVVPGRPLAIVTDEIYPVPVAAGCPWGWMRVVDIADPAAPTVTAEYKLPQNDPAICPGDNGPPMVTYTAHNTTATENLALVTWHAGGLQAIDISDPSAPTQLTAFLPEPLPTVATEDPALGGDPVLMWSYPIIKDGLIYVIDIRNGLYILRYTGPHEDEIASTTFREGNSNLR